MIKFPAGERPRRAPGQVSSPLRKGSGAEKTLFSGAGFAAAIIIPAHFRDALLGGGLYEFILA